MGQCAILFEPGWPTSPAWMHTALIYGLSACMTLQFLRRAFLEDVLFPNRPFFGDYRTFWTVTVVWPFSDVPMLVKDAVKKSTHGPLTRAVEQTGKRDIYFLRAVQAGIPDKEDDLYASHSAMGDKLISGLGEGEAKVTQLLVRPENFSNQKAMDMHDLDPIDAENFSLDLKALLEDLPSADTIHFPYGTAYKLDRRMPFIRVSLSDYEGDLTRLGLHKAQKLNTAAPTPPEGDDAYDVTDAMLEKLPFLRDRPVLDLLTEATAPIELYAAIGRILPAVAPVPPTDRAMMHAHMNDPSPNNYEVQIRGIRSASPRVVLRVAKSNTSKIPVGWDKVPAEPLPPCCFESKKGK